MAINRIPYPNSLPTVVGDYQAQNVLVNASFSEAQNQVPWSGTAMAIGFVFQCGGTVYRVDTSTTITGSATEYIKITPSGATATASFVANLTGVAWSTVYSGYYDGSGNRYFFDEYKAYQAGIFATTHLQYIFPTAIGLGASATTNGASLGKDSISSAGGFAGGEGSSATFGAGAIGIGSSSVAGGAVGPNTESNSGFAGGYGSKTYTGVACGTGRGAPHDFINLGLLKVFKFGFGVPYTGDDFYKAMTGTFSSGGITFNGHPAAPQSLGSEGLTAALVFCESGLSTMHRSPISGTQYFRVTIPTLSPIVGGDIIFYEGDTTPKTADVIVLYFSDGS